MTFSLVRTICLILVLAIAGAGLGLAQTPFPITQPKLSQLPGQSSSTGLVYVVKPDGSVAFAQLAANIVLDLSTNPPTLRVVAQAPQSQTVFVTGETLPSNALTVTLANTPITGTVSVYRNGLRQKVGADYTIAGNTITFVDYYAGNQTDLIQADYQHLPPTP